ncbi:hypothetical protein [Wenxinia saemankumensis]|uniref:Lipoprotein n=1 Tax=Wenxinia saemankumensis TaxID=1447782 RepID=A0A1M6HE12_9RHOB|nr:hypothetical protein [Wenxinia saemankumensis]SHJ20422.1 hypothetical protein SAMN05444417_3182 [Wenxinia saemankumensis]
MPRLALIALAALAAAGCAPSVPQGDGARRFAGVETRLLDGDLVSFLVEVENPRSREDLDDYARCAAAQYTLIRGYSFARHVRTLVEPGTGIWRADAVYTISPDLPRGVRTIDAEVTVANCALNGIPSV